MAPLAGKTDLMIGAASRKQHGASDSGRLAAAGARLLVAGRHADEMELQLIGPSQLQAVRPLRHSAEAH
jgi:hypothetical protein